MQELASSLAALTGQPGAAAWLGLLALRVLPAAVLVPWLGLGSAQIVLSLAAGLALALALAPLAFASSAAALAQAAPLAFTLALVPQAFAELLRGALFGFAVALPLSAFAWTGALADRLASLRGGAVAFAAHDEPSYAMLERLYRIAAFALFFASGGHRVVIAAFADALRSHPLGSLPEAAALGATLQSAAQLLVDALSLTVSLFAPVSLCVLIAALSLPVLARVVRALAAISLAGPVALCVIGAACLTLAHTLPALSPALSVFVAHAVRLLRMLG